MLKLKGNPKYSKLPSDIIIHLASESCEKDAKLRMLCIILFSDLICGGLIIAIGDTFFTTISLPFMIGINLWTVVVLFLKQSDRNDLHFTLYMGATGAVYSFCYFVLSQELVYVLLGYNLLFIITSLLAYVIVILSMVRHYFIVFPNYKKKKNCTNLVNYLCAFGGFAYLAAFYLLHFFEGGATLFLSYTFLAFTFFFSFMGVKFIHKFFFIKANQDMIVRRLKKRKYSRGRKSFTANRSRRNKNMIDLRKKTDRV
ncbi:hypothetical protein [Bacillus swezeyi]|uniref:hypothetical protein n=1 Tax=Bacillus swezeyi TaxID=1925020 RepID=UPI0027DB9056|nr:hypothetical protein [Bacillus swezeyi]